LRLHWTLGGARNLASARLSSTGGDGDAGITLLIVDDDDDLRSIVAEFLSDAGYLVLQAEGGPQALTLLADDPSLRIMITDIRMPGMSGLELADEAIRRRPELRVILISGYANQQYQWWPFLMKPFQMSSLTDLIARELGRE
jgi:two-component system cell cycle response regulator CpdR